VLPLPSKNDHKQTSLFMRLHGFISAKKTSST
jgi:hypothetical protein